MPIDVNIDQEIEVSSELRVPDASFDRTTSNVSKSGFSGPPSALLAAPRTRRLFLYGLPPTHAEARAYETRFSIARRSSENNELEVNSSRRFSDVRESAAMPRFEARWPW